MAGKESRRGNGFAPSGSSDRGASMREEHSRGGDGIQVSQALSQYRDSDKREIDFLIENAAGAMLGIEVKSGSAIGIGDFKHLKWFAKTLFHGPFTGIVLYGGTRTLRFGEGFYAVPLGALA